MANQQVLPMYSAARANESLSGKEQADTGDRADMPHRRTRPQQGVYEVGGIGGASSSKRIEHPCITDAVRATWGLDGRKSPRVQQ